MTDVKAAMEPPEALPDWILEGAPPLVSRRLRAWLDTGEIAGVEGHYQDGWLELTVFVALPEGARRHEASVRVERSAAQREVAEDAAEDAAEAELSLALDAAEAALAEWLEAGREERFRNRFEASRFQGRDISLRRRVRYPALEAEAQQLLDP